MEAGEQGKVESMSQLSLRAVPYSHSPHATVDWSSPVALLVMTQQNSPSCRKQHCRINCREPIHTEILAPVLLQSFGAISERIREEKLEAVLYQCSSLAFGYLGYPVLNLFCDRRLLFSHKDRHSSV